MPELPNARLQSSPSWHAGLPALASNSNKVIIDNLHWVLRTFYPGSSPKRNSMPELPTGKPWTDDYDSEANLLSEWQSVLQG